MAGIVGRFVTIYVYCSIAGIDQPINITSISMNEY